MHIQLSQIRISSPCPASWDDMAGDDRSRFCERCRLNVYNISAMTQRQAEALIREKEGRVCLRLYRRADGTVMTRDCPVGWAALRRRAVWLTCRIAAAFALLAGGFAWAVDVANPYRSRVAMGSTQPLTVLSRWLHEPAMEYEMGGFHPTISEMPSSIELITLIPAQP